MRASRLEGWSSCRLVCASWTALRGRFAAPQDEAVGVYNDSEMAPQALEISQNGLSDPPARGSPDARVVKRSLVVAGHRTSISLEDAFWRRLRAIAAERGLSLNRLAAMVDASRGGANLSSAIRVFVLEAEGAGPSRERRATADRVDQ